MKQLLFICFTFLMATQAMAQNDFDISTDKENGQKVFKGEVDFQTLKAEPSFKWFAENEQSFKPDTGTLNQIKPVMDQYNYVVLMGTWCSDSHYLLPRLYKVFEYAHVPKNHVQMFGVDRAKEAKYQEHKIYQVTNVPTIIVRRGPKEIGRIVETVKESLEKDLAYLILRDQENKTD